MPLIAAYHRPTTIGEALALLAEPNRVPLAGGTTINADRSVSDLEVVDLQALGLDVIEVLDDRLRIGATATFDAVAAHVAVPAALRRIARAEEPSTLRTLATVGGTIAGRSSESVFLAGLLVHDAVVEFAGGAQHPLHLVLTHGVAKGGIITAVTIATDGETADAGTGRTPADTPIVAAVARSTGLGTTVALTGVAPTPIVVDASNPTAGLNPVGDFRGTPAYRLELARILTARAIGALA